MKKLTAEGHEVEYYVRKLVKNQSDGASYSIQLAFKSNTVSMRKQT